MIENESTECHLRDVAKQIHTVPSPASVRNTMLQNTKTQKSEIFLDSVSDMLIDVADRPGIFSQKSLLLCNSTQTLKPFIKYK